MGPLNPQIKLMAIQIHALSFLQPFLSGTNTGPGANRIGPTTARPEVSVLTRRDRPGRGAARAERVEAGRGWPPKNARRRAAGNAGGSGFYSDDRRTSANVSNTPVGCFLGQRFWLCRKL